MDDALLLLLLLLLPCSLAASTCSPVHVFGDAEEANATETNATVVVIALITGTFKQADERRLDVALHVGAVPYAMHRHSLRPAASPAAFGVRVCETGFVAARSVRHMAHVSDQRLVHAVIAHHADCRTEATIAAAYNLPMMSVTCEDPELSDKNRFPTFTRVRPQPGGVAKLVVSLLRHFNWTKVALIHPLSSKNRLVTEHVRTSFKQFNITRLHDRPYDLPYDHPSNQNRDQPYPTDENMRFEAIVAGTMATARIYVVLGNIQNTVGFIHAMDSRGLLSSGKYFVVGADVAPNDANKMDWIEYWNSRNYYFSAAATRSYLHLSLRGQRQVGKMNMVAAGNHLYLKRKPFNISGMDQRPIRSHFNMYFLVDAVSIYMDTIERLMAASDFNATQLRDGRLISRLMRGRTYKSSLNFLNRIDQNGDTEGNYTVFRLSMLPRRRRGNATVPGASDFQVERRKMTIGNFFMSDNLTGLPSFHKETRLVWVAGRRPVDEPACGFQGQRCAEEKDITGQLVPTFACALFFVLCVVLVFLYRNHRLEQELDMLLWKIEFKDLSLLNAGAAQDEAAASDAVFSRSPSDVREEEENEALLTSKSCSTVTTRSHSSLVLMAGYADLEFGKMHARAATYKKQIVAVKKIFKVSVNVSRVIKKELKLLRDITNQTNQNLTKFLGACVDEGNVCAIWEYCERGSLQDILYNEDLSLEPMFMASLVCDLLNGLAFLHDSDLRCHGNLKSSNCVVDSRWTLKMTDFGLAEFRNGETVDHIDEDVYFYGLFWTAPELLRYMVCRRPYSALSGHMVRMAQALKDTIFDRDTFQATAPDFPALMRADIYALGVVIYEIYSRQRPYHPHNNSPFEIVRRVIVLNDEFHDPYRPTLSVLSTVEKVVTDTIAACWAEQPSLRPTAKQVRNRLRDVVGNRSRNIFDNMMNLMETYAKNLERLVNERTGQLVEEKKRTEELLYQMLPVSVAEQLKRNKRVEAEAFDSVTIYFSDVVGFTELSAESTPFEVVQLLNDLYTACDHIIAAYHVYKVETIGDAYMVVSGVPRRYHRHAAEIADMAMELLKVITSGFVIRHRPGDTLKLRIGLHSGACCAGVVGTKMPRFCLFGDTVNMASRMESTGEPGKIHISEQCKAELDAHGGYQVVERGETQIKGRGATRTFWLSGRSDDSLVFDAPPAPSPHCNGAPAAPPAKGKGLMRSLMSSAKGASKRGKQSAGQTARGFKSAFSFPPTCRPAVASTSSGKAAAVVAGMLNSACTDGAPV